MFVVRYRILEMFLLAGALMYLTGREWLRGSVFLVIAAAMFGIRVWVTRMKKQYRRMSEQMSETMWSPEVQKRAVERLRREGHWPPKDGV